MKKIIAFLVLLMILSTATTSCTTAEALGGNGASGDDQGQSFSLTGIVKDVSDRVEVEIIGSDYAFGIYWVLVSDKTELVGADGAAISLSDIAVGDTVEIIYGGQTMMSYPPQIVARKITVK